jgi:hypothetical protein
MVSTEETGNTDTCVNATWSLLAGRLAGKTNKQFQHSEGNVTTQKPSKSHKAWEYSIGIFTEVSGEHWLAFLGEK